MINIGDLVTGGAGRWDALNRNEAYARLVEAGITWESWVRRSSDRVLRAWGVPTAADVARVGEQVAAVEAGEGASSRGRRPVVHWHEGGAGPPLLLLNGWTASGIMWPGQWLRRLETRFRVIRIDNRGSGWSRNAPAPFTIADMADDAAAVLRATGVGQATVAGLSMGGMIAQELASRHPKRVSQLIIMASRPPSPAHLVADQTVLRGILAPPNAKPLPVYFRDLWAAFTGPGFDAPELLDELVEQILTRPTPRNLLLQQTRAIMAWNGPSRLASISAPTVIVHGVDDRLMPVGNGMRLARLIPGARYVELRDTGHLLPMEAPDAIAELILARPASPQSS
jgi:pimeloyl-ACP methyl ester carboxylesterase